MARTSPIRCLCPSILTPPPLFPPCPPLAHQSASSSPSPTLAPRSFLFISVLRERRRRGATDRPRRRRLGALKCGDAASRIALGSPTETVLVALGKRALSIFPATSPSSAIAILLGKLRLLWAEPRQAPELRSPAHSWAGPCGDHSPAPQPRDM